MRGFTGREETPQEAMKRLAETFVEGKQLGSWSGKSVEVHRSATREQRVMDERDAEERESQKRAREKARAPKRNKGPMRERLVRRNADKLAAGMLRYGLRFTETPEGEQRERQYGEDEDLAPTVARLFFKSASDEELASIVETARQEASAILRKMGATEKGLGVSYAEAKKLVDAERALDIGGGMREALGTYAEANEDAAAFGAAETRRARRETQWKTGRIGARKLSREEQAQLGIPVFDGVATPAWAENAARAIAKAYEHPSATGVARETLAGELRVAARHLPNSAATERAYREIDRIKGAGNLAEIINHANTAERIISQGWNKASFEEVRSALERTLAPFARFTPRKAEKDRRTAGMTEIFLNACRKAQDMSADEVATEIEKLSAFIDKATPEMFDDPHTLALVQQRQAYALFTRYENAVKRKDASALQDILSAIESRRAEGDVELARRIEKQKREAQDISAILANATKVKGRNKAQRVSATGALLEKVGTLFMGSLTLKQLVEDGFRFCKDEKLRAAAQHEIDKLNGEIARANQERTLLENESRVWLCKKTVEIFGGKKTGAKNRGVEATAKEATAIMLELSVPRKEYAKFSRDGETPLSYAQILAQYAMIRQADVLEPVRDVENEDALDVSGRSLCARVAKIDELRQAVGPRGIAFIDALSEHYMSEGEAIDKVAMDVAGVPVTLRQADYSPIVRDISENNPNKAHDAPLSYVPAVMTPRVPNLRDINENVDIFSVFVRRAQDTSHFRAFGRMHLKLARIFSDKAYSDAYNKTEGTTRAQQLVNIVRDVLSSKLPSSPKDSPEQFLGMVVSTTAKIALGGNALVALRQPTSITSYAHDVGWAKTFRAMMSIGTDLSGAIERMNAIRKSPEWFSRYGTEELRIQLDALNVSNPKLWWRRFMSLYMAANRWGDKVPILLIGQGIYGATLQTLRNSVNPQTGKVYTEEEAKKAAMAAVWDATEKTQMASSPANMSVWQRSGSTAVRMLAQFQSSTNLFLSAEVKAFRDLSANPRSAKAWRQFASVMFNNHVVIPGMFELVGLIFRNLIWGDDDDDEFFSEEDLRDLAIAMLLGPASGVWFLGSALTGLLTSQSYSGMTTPVFSMVNRLARSSKKVASAASEGDTDELLEALDDMGKIFAPYRDIRRFYDNYIGDDS